MGNGKPTAQDLTRRHFLQASGGLAASASLLGLAGCSGSDTSSGPDVHIKIPDAKNKLPKGDVTFRLMDSDDTKTPFWEKFFAAYEKKHPNITCKYDGLPWNRIEEVAPLGFRNGKSHDVLQVPGTIPIPQAVGEGWIGPVDDVIPDFDKWKASFPDGTFADGVQIFDGKCYMVPLATEQRHQALIHYNKELLDKAGYNPTDEQLTWDDFRAAARKITKQGDGQAYGLALEIGQAPRLSIIVRYLARSAGAATATPLGDVDLRTGEYFYDRDEVAEAIELLLSIKKDGSMFPGSSSLAAPEAWPRVVRGNAGMVFGGPWVTVLWEDENPDFKFGVGNHPVPDKNPIPPGYPVFGTDAVNLYAHSKLKNVAGDVLSYVTSVEGQKAWGKFVGVGNPPINEEAREATKKLASKQGKSCLRLAEQMVINPEPVIRSSGVAVVTREQKQVSPNFDDVIQAILVGKEHNIRKALRNLKSRQEKAFDDAIAAARKKGEKVSRDDYVFPNWNPRKDYTKADY